MAYVHCLPARILHLRHGLDNVISGTIETDDDEIPFRTRGHVVKAVNRVYRGSSWKPSAGERILIDGDLGAGGIVIDHVEPDHATDEPCHSPHLDAIALTLPKHPPASSTLRVRRGGQHRIRFAAPITGRDRRGAPRPSILHGRHDPETGVWNLWTVSQAEGALVGAGIDEHVLAAIAMEAGFDVAVPEMTDPDDAPARPRVEDKPPFDDCPF